MDTVLELNKKLEDENTFAQATKLRNESKLWKIKYEVQGRKALKALMAQVYACYLEIKRSNEQSTTWTKLRAHVVDVDKVELKSNAKETHVLVRYVFSGFSDKQVSVYGTTLAKAYKAKIAADDFESYVDDNMGFQNTATGTTAKKKQGEQLDKQDSLATEGKAYLMNVRARNAEFLGTNKKIDDWQEGEQYRIYACVREKEGWEAGIALKELWLTEAQIDVVLAMFAENVKGADKATNAATDDSDDYKKRMLTATSEKAAALTALEDLACTLPQAVQDGNRRLFTQLQEDKKKAELRLRDANLAIAQLKKEKAQAA